MVSKNQEEGRLPPGWELEIRVTNSRNYKCYINKKINKKFYSKLSMLQYINNIGTGNESSSTTEGHTEKISAKKQLHAEEANDLDEWLPSGWIMELKTRKTGLKKGTKYKCFIDPTSGSKFFSKPEVHRYLESLQSNPGLSQQKEKGSSRHSSDKKSPDPPSALNSCMESNVSQLSETRVQKCHSLGKRKVVIETTTDNELPPGWIKEIRNKMAEKRVVRIDQFYIDPAGLVFRSKADALRYIKTGEVSKHAYWRKNISNNDEEYATSPAGSDEREKTTKTITGKQLFTDELSPKQCISSLPEASCIKETGSKRITRSSSNHDHSILLLQPTVSAQETSPGKSLTENIDATEVTRGMTKTPLPKVQVDVGMKDDATPRESRRMTRSSSKVVSLEPSNSAQETTPRKSLTKNIDATEGTGSVTKMALPKVQVDDGKRDDDASRESKRRTRSSSKVGNLEPANSAQETTPRKSLTKEIDATEGTGSVTKMPLPKVQVDDGKRDDDSSRESKRRTKSSLKVVNLEPVNSVQETSPGKSLTKKIDETGSMTKRPLPKVQDDDGKKDDATSRESKRMTRSSSKVVSFDHSILLVQPTNNSQETSPGKSLTEKIDATEAMTKLPLPNVQVDDGKKDGATPRESKGMTRSFLGVANLDQDTSPGKSLTEKIYATEVTEGMTIVPLPKVQDDDSKKDYVPHRKSNPFTVPSKDKMLLEEKPETVAIKNCSNVRVQTTKNKIKDRKQTPFHSSKQLVGKFGKVLADTSLESREKPRSLDFVARDVSVEIAEKNQPLNTMLATHEGPSRLCFQPEIDLLERYPPGFSQNPRIESSPIRTDPSVYPKNAFMGNKIENSFGNSQLSKDHPNELRESRIENFLKFDPSQVEQPVLVEREIQSSESPFCFTSPMWSDPCLEFAYKTLTGAIPLDDSLAIQDYIQHQIRTTSEQSNNNRSLPNLGVPSNVPEDIGVPKFNGVSIPKNK